MRYLFDVNFLIAILIGSHSHYQRAHDWWRDHAGNGWASCPITENGFVRIVSQPSFAAPLLVAEGIELLKGAKSDTDNAFWNDDISIVDDTIFDTDYLLKSNQITDAYLLALAIKNKGKLVTFDRSLGRRAAIGDVSRHLVTL